MTHPAPSNALSIDVEDYFQVWALTPHIARDSWDSRPCRVEHNIERILGLMDKHGAKGTFFTLGWVAERYPQLVRRIVDGGHELASHGYGHGRVDEQTPQAFREDISHAKKLLEDIGGVAVRGYRAPSFSIGLKNLWALDVIRECGYAYSSSIYPVKHDHYGIPDSPRFAYRHDNGLIEIPVTTAAALGRNLPAGGGGYFRLLPYAASRWLMRHVHKNDGESTIFYFHPWEIDPGQPRIAGVGWKSRFRHYVNLGRMAGKLDRLLGDFRWDRVDRIFLPRFFPATTPASD
jgi:polysaccharide deacetylase family protein (PEP-CTERM system associated)